MATFKKGNDLRDALAFEGILGDALDQAVEKIERAIRQGGEDEVHIAVQEIWTETDHLNDDGAEEFFLSIIEEEVDTNNPPPAEEAKEKKMPEPKEADEKKADDKKPEPKKADEKKAEPKKLTAEEVAALLKGKFATPDELKTAMAGLATKAELEELRRRIPTDYVTPEGLDERLDEYATKAAVVAGLKDKADKAELQKKADKGRFPWLAWVGVGALVLLLLASAAAFGAGQQLFGDLTTVQTDVTKVQTDVVAVKTGLGNKADQADLTEALASIETNRLNIETNRRDINKVQVRVDKLEKAQSDLERRLDLIDGKKGKLTQLLAQNKIDSKKYLEEIGKLNKEKGEVQLRLATVELAVRTGVDEREALRRITEVFTAQAEKERLARSTHVEFRRRSIGRSLPPAK